MRKSLLIIAIFVVLALLVFFFNRRQTIAPTINNLPPPVTTAGKATTAPATPATASPTKAVTTSQTFVITYQAGALSPAQLTIHVGDTVKFVNNDSSPHWPASGPHPTHHLCPGFDSGRELRTGDSYSFTFGEAKTCVFHDHRGDPSSLRGLIVVLP